MEGLLTTNPNFGERRLTRISSGTQLEVMSYAIGSNELRGDVIKEYCRTG